MLVSLSDFPSVSNCRNIYCLVSIMSQEFTKKICKIYSKQGDARMLQMLGVERKFLRINPQSTFIVHHSSEVGKVLELCLRGWGSIQSRLKGVCMKCQK